MNATCGIDGLVDVPGLQPSLMRMAYQPMAGPWVGMLRAVGPWGMCMHGGRMWAGSDAHIVGLMRVVIE